MPTNTRPNAANRPFKKPAKMPNTSIGTAAGLRLTLWPASASSQMPPVAPRLVPKITAMPPASPIKPVLKKAMVKSDTKVLDCKTNVAPMPNISPRAGVAVLLAITSSLRGKALPKGFIAFGEVGLAGEVRPAPRGQERLKEAAKLGFTRALIPEANKPKQAIPGMEVIAVRRVEEAVARIRELE